VKNDNSKEGKREVVSSSENELSQKKNKRSKKKERCA